MKRKTGRLEDRKTGRQGEKKFLEDKEDEEDKVDK
jgi:hypothetical protein